MISGNVSPKQRKRERIKINNIDDFIGALNKEGYSIGELNEANLQEKVIQTFRVEKDVANEIHRYIINRNITYRANNIKDFIDYVEKIMIFENENSKLRKKIDYIKKLKIYRLEYENEQKSPDDVEEVIKAVEEIKDKISERISDREKIKLGNLEKELDKGYIYSKDIELLKKIVLCKNENVEEHYNANTKIKTLSIGIPEKINYDYIKSQKGSVEYHEYLTNNIPRINRLIRSIHKYIKVNEDDKVSYKLDQGEALQDSINIAIAIFDNQEFRAISGSNEIKGFCKSPSLGDATFKSCKVNRLGEVGIGYNRVNDSEKKILEEIHKQIEEKGLNNEGNLILYSKWEPCPSCYYVITQFSKRHPNINIQVKFDRKYGEST